MSQNVSQQIADTKPLLLQKIEENGEIANVLMALLGKLVINYRTQGEIRMAPIMVEDNEFRSRIIVIQNPLARPPRLVMHNDLRDYMVAKNIALAKVLTLNKDIADFFQELVSRLVAYSDFKNIPFKELRVIQGGAFITKDHEFVLRVGREAIVDFTPFDKTR